MRTTPIALASRRNLNIWAALAPNGNAVTLTSNAQQVAQFITAHGASFFEDIVAGSPFVARAQDWPRGYPGDFETIEWLWSGDPAGLADDALGAAA